MHLKRCNPVVCRVKDRKTLEVSHEDEYRWLQAERYSQFKLQNKVLQIQFNIKLSELNM